MRSLCFGDERIGRCNRRVAIFVVPERELQTNAGDPVGFGNRQIVLNQVVVGKSVYLRVPGGLGSRHALFGLPALRYYAL